MELIDEIKKALTQITPTPWMRKDNEVWTVGTDKDGYHTQIVKKVKCAQCDYDLNFITYAPKWLKSLIELVEQQSKNLAEGEKHFNAMKNFVEFHLAQLEKQNEYIAKIKTAISEKDTLIKSLKTDIEISKGFYNVVVAERRLAWQQIESLQKENQYIISCGGDVGRVIERVYLSYYRKERSRWHIE